MKIILTVDHGTGIPGQLRKFRRDKSAAIKQRSVCRHFEELFLFPGKRRLKTNLVYLRYICKESLTVKRNLLPQFSQKLPACTRLCQRCRHHVQRDHRNIVSPKTGNIISLRRVRMIEQLRRACHWAVRNICQRHCNAPMLFPPFQHFRYPGRAAGHTDSHNDGLRLILRQFQIPSCLHGRGRFIFHIRQIPGKRIFRLGSRQIGIPAACCNDPFHITEFPA